MKIERPPQFPLPDLGVTDHPPGGMTLWIPGDLHLPCGAGWAHEAWTVRHSCWWSSQGRMSGAYQIPAGQGIGSWSPRHTSSSPWSGHTEDPRPPQFPEIKHVKDALIHDPRHLFINYILHLHISIRSRWYAKIHVYIQNIVYTKE